MKYEQENEEINYSMRNTDVKPYNDDDDHRPNKKLKIIIFIIIIVIIIGLIIFLVLYFKKKNTQKDGGYIITKYICKSSKSITIFNPSYLNLESTDYSIELLEIESLNSNNSLRILQDYVTIYNDKFTSKKKGIISFKIKFNTILTTMSQMFEECENLVDVDLSNFISSQVTSLNSAFSHCYSLENINFANFKSSNIITMYATFESCEELTGLDLSSFDDTSNLKSMNSLFKNCFKLSFINLKNFKFVNSVNLRETFYPSNNLKMVIVDDTETKTKIYKNQNLTDNTNINCILGQNEKCKECQTSESEKFKCKSCNNGYYLPKIDYPTSCKKCFIDNCNSCSDYINCDNCNEGYYLTNNKDECSKCTEGCNNCNTKDKCIQCNDNYKLENGICLKNENITQKN